MTAPRPAIPWTPALLGVVVDAVDRGLVGPALPQSAVVERIAASVLDALRRAAQPERQGDAEAGK